MMLNAVSYCHSKGVVHCDLKLENFVFESRKAGAQMKLIDFGLSKKYKRNGRPVNKVVGTAYYVAPEVLKKQDYRSSCDMWAMGVILFMMLSGVPPFNGSTDAQIVRAIRSGKFRMGPSCGCCQGDRGTPVQRAGAAHSTASQLGRSLRQCHDIRQLLSVAALLLCRFD